MLDRAFADARRLAAEDLTTDGVSAEALPADCPYTLDQIRDPDWFPLAPVPGK
jgi:hypothetical protein